MAFLLLVLKQLYFQQLKLDLIFVLQVQEENSMLLSLQQLRVESYV